MGPWEDSRREADDAVSAGRVRVNGELVRPSLRVRSGDAVTLDGKRMNWEPFAQACEADLGAAGSSFVYLKYNKPRGARTLTRFWCIGPFLDVFSFGRLVRKMRVNAFAAIASCFLFA